MAPPARHAHPNISSPGGVNCAVFSSCFYEGSVKRLSALVRLGPLRAFDKELFGVYGKHYPHLVAWVALFHDAHRLAYASCLHRHPEGCGPFLYFQGDLYHPRAPPRRASLLCMSARPPDAARRETVIRGILSGELGKAAFGVVRGERRCRPIPSFSMALRQRGRQQVNECCSV